MATTLKQLIKNRRLLKKLESKGIGECGVCHKPITDEHPDEVRTINGKIVHEDCYYEELGKGIEQHPICHPGMHRLILHPNNKLLF